jgi:hypothetical protein
MSFGDGSLNLPFEQGPDGQTIPIDNSTLLASGVVILAGVMPVPGVGLMPCLIYRFARPDGSGFYSPIALVIPDDEMFMTVKLTQDAARASVRETKKRRAEQS